MNSMNFEQARFNMIEQQIRPWDVLDTHVLDTLTHTPREDFTPPAYRSLAFSDISIPLGHNESMMPPRLEGRLLQSLRIGPKDRILEIGTGSGYLSACLARLGESVLSVDLYANFISAARAALDKQKITNVELREWDAAQGWNPAERFDVIAVSGSLPQLHRGFHESLNIGGRLFVIVGQPPIMEALLITRISAGEWIQESLFETSLPPLVHTVAESTFAL